MFPFSLVRQAYDDILQFVVLVESYCKRLTKEIHRKILIVITIIPFWDCRTSLLCSYLLYHPSNVSEQAFALENLAIKCIRDG